MSVFEVIRGVEGCCLALDDTRIAGPKPWGGGTVIHAWETDKEYKAVDTQSRWFDMFGTPERAARTMAGKCGDCCECVIADYCEHGCDEGCLLSCACDYDALIEWLRGESDGE